MNTTNLPPIVKKADSILNEPDPQAQGFEYQLEFLKLEINTINETIKRIDELAQNTKNWTILVWGGSILLALNKDQEYLRPYIGFTAILPLLFWFVDAWYRRIQRGFIFRQQKIAEFLNSQQFIESFQQRRLIDFRVLDPRGSQYKHSKEYQSFTGVLRTLRFKEVGVFYLGLSFISIIIGVFLRT